MKIDIGAMGVGYRRCAGGIFNPGPGIPALDRICRRAASRGLATLVKLRTGCALCREPDLPVIPSPRPGVFLMEVVCDLTVLSSFTHLSP